MWSGLVAAPCAQRGDPMTAATVRFHHAGGRSAFYVGPGRYRVFGLEGLSIERFSDGWYIVAEGDRICGSYPTMRRALAEFPKPNR